MDGRTDTQNFGGYNIIPRHFLVAGHNKKKPEDQLSCNAHLTPGPGQGERFCIFSQFQTCIYSPRSWAYNHFIQGQHFKVFIISIILYQYQKDHYCLIILYDILFYFITVYIAQKTTLGDNFLKEAERSYHFYHWLHVSKNIFAL